MPPVARKASTTTTRKAVPAAKTPPTVQKPAVTPPKEAPMPTATIEGLSPMFQEVTETVAKRNVPSKLNAELSEAIRISYRLEKRFSMPIADTPPMTRNGVTTQDAKTATNYIRRHAAAEGLGISIVPYGEDRISFLAQDKRKVPTNETGRKPRENNNN
jgi:hypothetical protein